MEIERKWLLSELPGELDSYPHTDMVQGYICTDPTVRVRKDGDRYILTVKGRGLIAREEYNLVIEREGYERLLAKCEGILIEKTRYRIPITADGTRIAPGTVPADGMSSRAYEPAELPGGNYGSGGSFGTESPESAGADRGLREGSALRRAESLPQQCYTAELDVFSGVYGGLKYAEVEFPDIAEAEAFKAPEWFGREVTGLPGYSNGDLARGCAAGDAISGR